VPLKDERTQFCGPQPVDTSWHNSFQALREIVLRDRQSVSRSVEKACCKRRRLCGTSQSELCTERICDIGTISHTALLPDMQIF
jgi:hypothetical protein